MSEQVKTIHLTKEQIMSYYVLTSKDREGREIGRHLLNCAECRKELPFPTREQFLRALFGDGSDEDDLDD